MQAAAGQRLGGVEIIENHAQRHAIPRDALHVWNVRRIERKRPREVGEATAREDLRFEERGYGDSLRPKRHLPASQLETLVRLDVRPQRDVELLRAASHGVEVPLHHIAIEQ